MFTRLCVPNNVGFIINAVLIVSEFALSRVSLGGRREPRVKGATAIAPPLYNSCTAFASGRRLTRAVRVLTQVLTVYAVLIVTEFALSRVLLGGGLPAPCLYLRK